MKSYITLLFAVGALVFACIPNTTMAATTTVRIYGSAGDGEVLTAPYPGSWTTQHEATVGRDPNSTSTVVRVQSAASQYASTGYLGITRGFAVFDTSIIPDDAEIIGSELNLNITDKLDHYNDTYSYISISQGFQNSTSTIVSADVDMCGSAITNPAKGTNDVDITGITLNQYQPFTFNSTGEGWISKTGYTKLCVREGHDVENIPVTNTPPSGWKESRIYFSSSEASGTSTDPYLDVTYVTEDADTSPYLEVTYTVRIPVTETEDTQSPGQLYDTWNNTRSYTTGEIRGDASDVVSSQAYNSSHFAFTRPFFTFDTSAIPDDAVIDSASLNLYVDSVIDQVNNSYSYVSILEGNAASSTNIVGSDYNDCGALNNPTLGSSLQDISSISTDAYHSFALNSTGESWINPLGYTELCMRDGHDIENQPFSSNFVWKSNFIGYSKD